MAKTLKLKNRDLTSIYDMLDKLGVEGYKEKRGKGKLMRNIKTKFEEYTTDLKDIQKDYFVEDDEGNLKQEMNDHGQKVFIWQDKHKNDKAAKEQANIATKELQDEEAVISLVENETKIKSFLESVQEDKFTTNEGFKDEPFEILMDALEETYKEEENE